MRNSLNILLKFALLALAMTSLLACSTTPTINIGAMSPKAQRVAQALEQWPEVPGGGASLRRQFFTTIHVAGKRTTASGVLDYHNARDFRVTAVTEVGVVLFDARVNWAGVTVLRSMPGLSKSMVGLFVQDLSRAMHLPASLDGLVEKDGMLVLKHAGSDTFTYRWVFDPKTGRLRQSEVDLGTFDTLRVDYLRYNSRGWPLEISVTRKARFYTITFTFTDNDNLAQRHGRENVQ